jgi:hypothetical protein
VALRGWIWMVYADRNAVSEARKATIAGPSETFQTVSGRNSRRRRESLHSPAPIGQGRRRGDAQIVRYYVSYVQFCGGFLSIHKTNGGGGVPGASGRGKAKGRSPVRESSDPMREAGEPSTGNVIVCCVALCPPHRGSHGLTTDIPAQRTTGQSQGRAKCDGDEPARPRAQYKGRSPKAPSEVLEELQ